MLYNQWHKRLSSEVATSTHEAQQIGKKVVLLNDSLEAWVSKAQGLIF